LLALRYADQNSGRLYEQETAGWYRQAGEGWVFYFMPGHSAKEFESPVYRQILVNALIWEPTPQEAPKAHE
jgi:type 1 glutamine amidotransferase